MIFTAPWRALPSHLTASEPHSAPSPRVGEGWGGGYLIISALPPPSRLARQARKATSPTRGEVSRASWQAYDPRVLGGSERRLAGGDVVRPHGDEFHVAALVDELAERRDLADLRAGRIELEIAVQRFQLSRQAEDRFAERELIEALGYRKRLLQHEPGGIAGDRDEAAL